MAQRAKDRVAKIRAEHTVEPLPADVVDALKAVVDRRAALLPDED